MSNVQEAFAPGIKVTAKGEEIVAMPYELLEIFDAVALIEPLSVDWDAAVMNKASLITTFIKMFAAHRGVVIGLIGMSIKKDAEWFKGLSGSEGVKIVRAVVKVNKDFFTDEVLPMFEETGIGLPQNQEPTATDGSTSSDSSPAPDTTPQE